MRAILTISSFLFLLASYAQPFSLNWVRQAGNTGIDGIRAIKSDNAGNVFAAGWFTGTVDFDPGAGVYPLTGPGQRNMFICKYAPSGAMLWAKAQTGDDRASAIDIAIDQSGNVLTTGFFTGTVDFDPGPGTFTLTSSPGRFESFVSKLDPQGNFLWTAKFGYCALDYGAAALKTDPQGNVLVTGIFEMTADFDPGTGVHEMSASALESAFILKLNSSGEFVWSRQINGAQGVDIDTDPSGAVYASGHFLETADLDPGPGTMSATSVGEIDIYVLKLTAAGDFVWAKHFGGTLPDQVTTIDVGQNGNIYLTGIYASEGVDFDPGTGVQHLPFHGWTDIFITKLDPNGDFVWSKGFGGEEYDRVWALVLDGQEQISMSGQFRVTVDFDPAGPGVYTLSSAGSGADDCFIARMDADGHFKWAAQLHGNMNYGLGIDLAPGNGLYLGGTFQNQTDFDPGPDAYTLSSPGGYSDGYLLRFTPDATAELAEQQTGFQLSCFPNPFTESLTVIHGAVSGNAMLSVVSSLGETVLKQAVTNAESTILSTGGLPAGMYFIRLDDGVAISRAKVVK